MAEQSRRSDLSEERDSTRSRRQASRAVARAVAENGDDGQVPNPIVDPVFSVARAFATEKPGDHVTSPATPADIMTLQRTLGNSHVQGLVQRLVVQRDSPAGDPADANATPQPAGDSTPSDSGLNAVADQLSKDTGTSLGIRIPLDAELVGLVANPGSPAPSSTPLPSAPTPTTAPTGGPPQKAQTGTATGSDRDEGLNPYRVRQGVLGDCYLMAAMAAVARVNPDAIRRLIKPHPPGKYDVTLYEHRWLISDATHVETVDTTVPTDASGQPLYGGNVQFKGDVDADRPLWPLLIEKAYAQWKGGYAAIGKGDFPATALENLTGHSAATHVVADYSPKELGERIEAARTKGKPVTAWTSTMPSDLTVIEKGKSAGEGIAKVGNNRVAYAHAYAVSSVELPVQTIDLQNPWGTDNIEDMPLADFKHAFFAWDEGSTS
jgi:hypothetical protein